MKGGNSDDEDMSEEQRTVLGQLRTSGKHRSVGTARTGAVKKGESKLIIILVQIPVIYIYFLLSVISSGSLESLNICSYSTGII